LKIVERRKSIETCSESGWFAYDFLLDSSIDEKFILSLKPFGSFLFLSMFKQPFFKTENDHYILKGVKGANFFRIAVHGDYLAEADRIEEYINNNFNNT
jgi:hypothetical protein